MGVQAGCHPRDDVRQGELNDAIFAANFGQLIRGEAPGVYRDADTFFRNTHPTQALQHACQMVFGRLADPKEAGAVVRLSTGFGGGKTHALMALWHLAKNIGNPALGAELLAPAGRPGAVKVIATDAEGAGYPTFARHEGMEARNLAADLFYKLGGLSALNGMGDANNPAASPDIDLIKAILPTGPLLILLDEIVVHMVRLTPQEVGNVLGFLRTLMTIVVSRPQTVLVMTDPADQSSNQQQAALLAKLTKDFQEQTGRSATVIEPIGEEGAQVIVRRLFDRVEPAAAAKASADYHALYERVADKFPNLVPKRAITVEYRREAAQNLPPAPSSA